jgi:hypothetical protein
MLAIVRIALNKPYTFVDFFPKIGIPVVAVVSTYVGLPLADADAPRALGMADA